MTIYTLEEIKQEHYLGMEYIGFDQFLVTYFTQTYDSELNFIGYYRSVEND